jgi:hypothetical protein
MLGRPVPQRGIDRSANHSDMPDLSSNTPLGRPSITGHLAASGVLGISIRLWSPKLSTRGQPSYWASKYSLAMPWEITPVFLAQRAHAKRFV